MRYYILFYLFLTAAICKDIANDDIIVIKLPSYINITFKKQKIRTIRCNKDFIRPLFKAFECLKDRKLNNLLLTYGGCYCYRKIAGRDKLSNHAHGMAIDLNTQGPELPPAAIACFKRAGLLWGGDWAGRRDPMHFEKKLQPRIRSLIWRKIEEIDYGRL